MLNKQTNLTLNHSVSTLIHLIINPQRVREGYTDRQDDYRNTVVILSVCLSRIVTPPIATLQSHEQMIS